MLKVKVFEVKRFKKHTESKINLRNDWEIIKILSGLKLM